MADNREKKTTKKKLVPRATKAEIDRICQIGVSIIVESNYNITRIDYDSELQERFGDIKSKDRLNNYREKVVKLIKESNPNFEFLTRKTASTKDKRYAAEFPLKNIGRFLNEVIIIHHDKVITVFKADPIYFDLKRFLSRLEEIQKTLEESDTDGYPVLKIYYNHSEYNGFETVMCDIFERQFSPLSDFIVSTFAHPHCSAIEFRRNYLVPLLEFAYRLFKSYWKPDGKKQKTK